MKRIVVTERMFRAELLFRASFRKRAITPREVALISLVFDRVWQAYEQQEEARLPGQPVNDPEGTVP